MSGHYLNKRLTNNLTKALKPCQARTKSMMSLMLVVPARRPTEKEMLELTLKYRDSSIKSDRKTLRVTDNHEMRMMKKTLRENQLAVERLQAENDEELIQL